MREIARLLEPLNAAVHGQNCSLAEWCGGYSKRPAVGRVLPRQGIPRSVAGEPLAGDITISPAVAEWMDERIFTSLITAALASLPSSSHAMTIVRKTSERFRSRIASNPQLKSSAVLCHLLTVCIFHATRTHTSRAATISPYHGTIARTPECIFSRASLAAFILHRFNRVVSR